MSEEKLVKLITEVVTSVLNENGSKKIFYVDDFECACILNNYDLNQNVKDILSRSKTEFSLKITGTTPLSTLYEEQLALLGFEILNKVNCNSNETKVEKVSEIKLNTIKIEKKIIDEKTIGNLKNVEKIYVKHNAIVTHLAAEQITKKGITLVREQK